jgi:hypothetical protein
MDLLSALYNFWHTYGSDIQNGAVVLSAIAAVWVIRSGRANSLKRNTMDLILHQESDRELIDARIAFNELKSGATKLATYGTPDQKNTTEAQTLRKVLNLHELTSVAIAEGVIDECVYRRWFNTTFTKDYQATKAYIEAARITYGNPKAFVEFEKTATRWENDNSWDAPPSWFHRKYEAMSKVMRA